MLTVADMLDVHIYVPSIEEQKSTIALFQELQSNIDLHQSLREKQCMIHAGFKSEVLYGKKRISL